MDKIVWRGRGSRRSGRKGGEEHHITNIMWYFFVILPADPFGPDFFSTPRSPLLHTSRSPPHCCAPGYPPGGSGFSSPDKMSWQKDDGDYGEILSRRLSPLFQPAFSSPSRYWTDPSSSRNGCKIQGLNGSYSWLYKEAV